MAVCGTGVYFGRALADEPSTGMDPLSKRRTWQLIEDLKIGRVVLLTTHSMEVGSYLLSPLVRWAVVTRPVLWWFAAVVGDGRRRMLWVIKSPSLHKAACEPRAPACS